MIVEKLIEVLQKCDPQLPVLWQGDYEINTVAQIKTDNLVGKASNVNDDCVLLEG